MADVFNVSEYLSIFMDEVDEKLQELNQDILSLEKNGDNKETIQKIFRAAHTLKGSSGTMGFGKMQELTHSMENVLDKIRKDEIYVSSDIVTILFECLDTLRVLKQALLNSDDSDVDTAPLMSRLAELVKGENKREPGGTTDSGEFVLDFDDQCKQLLNEGIMQGFRAVAVYIRLVSDCQMKSIRAFLVANNLKQVGDIVTSFPGKEDLENDNFSDSFVYVVVTAENETKIIEAVNSLSEISAVSIKEIKLEDIDKQDDNIQQFDFEISQGASTEGIHEVHDTNEAKKLKISQFMRVDVEKVDSFMNLIGELVISQTRIAQLSSTLKAQFKKNNEIDALLEVSQHVGRIVANLQEGVMKVRMLPIEQLLNRFPRLVRDLSVSSNKKVNFIAEGHDTELDRTIIEEISDPLIHLIRNCVDHGIEDPATRLSKGKLEEGTVRISATNKDSMIEIVVEDDGKGINAAIVKEKAVGKGILKREEADALTDADAINLIFKPGFSTAEIVSEVSGRGVGMDIVREHVERLNGIIDIDTEVGKGTRFTIKLPLTLAIIPSLLAQINDRTIAVSLSSVQEIVRINPKEISSINRHEAVVIRDRVLPLARLHSRFGGEEQQDRKNLFIVVVGSAEKRIGLVVDRLLGNQDIVIKSLGKYIGKIKGLSGATILGDGRIALILDAGYLVKQGMDRD